MVAVPGIRPEQSFAVTTLVTTVRSLHATHREVRAPQEHGKPLIPAPSPTSHQSPKKEEEIYAKSPKKNPTEELPIPYRQLHPTFRSPLTQASPLAIVLRESGG